MSQELKDFTYFKEVQLHTVNFDTGRIDTIRTVNRKGKIFTQRCFDVGSLNQDGYIRVWCNGSLRMKHRLLYFLYTNQLPQEIDHIDKNRANNSIENLRSVDRVTNTTGTVFKGRKTFSDQEIHKICELILQRIPDEKIANLFNCSRTAIMGIRHKRRHKKIADLYF